MKEIYSNICIIYSLQQNKKYTAHTDVFWIGKKIVCLSVGNHQERNICGRKFSESCSVGKENWASALQSGDRTEKCLSNPGFRSREGKKLKAAPCDRMTRNEKLGIYGVTSLAARNSKMGNNCLSTHLFRTVAWIDLKWLLVHSTELLVLIVPFILLAWVPCADCLGFLWFLVLIACPVCSIIYTLFTIFRVAWFFQVQINSR